MVSVCSKSAYRKAAPSFLPSCPSSPSLEPITPLWRWSVTELLTFHTSPSSSFNSTSSSRRRNADTHGKRARLWFSQSCALFPMKRINRTWNEAIWECREIRGNNRESKKSFSWGERKQEGNKSIFRQKALIYLFHRDVFWKHIGSHREQIKRTHPPIYLKYPYITYNPGSLVQI